MTFVATKAPAMTDANLAVVMAVRSPEVESTLRGAAAAEGFEISAADRPAALLRLVKSEAPSLVLIEDGAFGDDFDLAGLVTEIRSADQPAVRLRGVGVSVVVIGGSGQQSDAGARAREWMVWPSSLVYVRTKLRAWMLRRACRWQNAPLPHDEEARLATLRGLGVLDSEPEPRFDELTAQASATLDMPVALISLVDRDRQWFKSRHGIDATETPRDMSFCAHAVMAGETMQVPDALLEDRFADNPLVSGDPRVRFYAGAPLKMSDGTHVGTLCVIDYRPRLLDGRQLVELERLAARAASELER